MKIEVFKGADGQWYATIRAANGEPVFTSEGHENRADVMAMVTNTRAELAKSAIVARAR